MFLNTCLKSFVPQLSLLEIRNSENKFEIQNSKFEIQNSKFEIQIPNSKTFNVKFNFQVRISILPVKLTLNSKFEIRKIKSKFEIRNSKTFNVRVPYLVRHLFGRLIVSFMPHHGLSVGRLRQL